VRALGTSLAENFQFLSGRSMRFRKRRRCSSRGQVEKELDDPKTVVDQVPLPIVDLSIPALPQIARARRGEADVRPPAPPDGP
jgi:hypothetical protein